MNDKCVFDLEMNGISYILRKKNMEKKKRKKKTIKE